MIDPSRSDLYGNRQSSVSDGSFGREFSPFAAGTIVAFVAVLVLSSRVDVGRVGFAPPPGL